MQKYNRSDIMKQAHELRKDTGLSFGECQTRIWNKFRAKFIATKVVEKVKLAYDSKLDATIETVVEKKRIAYEYVESLKPLVYSLLDKRNELLGKGLVNEADVLARKLNALIEQINNKTALSLNYEKLYVGVRCAMENALLIDKKLIA